MINRILVLSAVAACAEPTSELSSELCSPQDAESGLCIPSWVQTRARNESRAEVVRVTGSSPTYIGAGCVANPGLGQVGCQVSFEYNNRTYYAVCIWQMYDDGTSSVSCTTGTIDP